MSFAKYFWRKGAQLIKVLIALIGQQPYNLDPIQKLLPSLEFLV